MSLNDVTDYYQQAIARLGISIKKGDTDLLIDVAIALAEDDPQLFNKLWDRSKIALATGNDAIVVKLADSLSSLDSLIRDNTNGFTVETDRSKVEAYSATDFDFFTSTMNLIVQEIGPVGLAACMETCDDCTDTTNTDLDKVRDRLIDQIPDVIMFMQMCADVKAKLHMLGTSIADFVTKEVKDVHPEHDTEQ